MFHGWSMGVSWIFQGCFKEVARVSQESFKGVEKEFSKVIRASCIVLPWVSRNWHWYFLSGSRVVQEFVKEMLFVI